MIDCLRFACVSARRYVDLQDKHLALLDQHLALQARYEALQDAHIEALTDLKRLYEIAAVAAGRERR